MITAKATKTGIDVKTAPTRKTSLTWTENSLKICLKFTGTTEAEVPVTLTHNLGYKPAVFFFAKVDGEWRANESYWCIIKENTIEVMTGYIGYDYVVFVLKEDA